MLARDYIANSIKAYLVKKLAKAFDLLSAHMRRNSEMLKALSEVEEEKGLVLILFKIDEISKSDIEHD